MYLLLYLLGLAVIEFENMSRDLAACIFWVCVCKKFFKTEWGS